MRLRFSSVTKGFLLAGLSIGVLVVSAASIRQGPIPDLLRHHTDLMLIICPPSLALGVLGLNHPSGTGEVLQVFSMVVLANTALYGMFGLVISQVYRLSKKFMSTSAA